MGSVAAGLASVGGSLAQAKELQLREQIEKIKIALEQERLRGEQARTGIEQQYADIAKRRAQIEAEREQRLGKYLTQPQISKWQVIGNTVLAAGQNPDGSPFVKTFQLDREVGMEMRALQDEIRQAPDEIQPILNSMVAPKVAEGDFKGAANDIRPILQAYAKSKIPGQDTVREGYQLAGPIDFGDGNGPVMVQIPTRTVTTKVPSGSVSPTLPTAPVAGGPLPAIPSPLTSGATDRPGARQSPAIPGVPAAPAAKPSPAKPQFSLPPGARIIGPKATSANRLKPEMDAGLRVLHVSLFGDPSGQTEDDKQGLKDVVGVLDSYKSRKLLIMAGAGKSPETGGWFPTINRLLHSAYYDAMSTKEKKYVYQLNRAVTAVNALRGITGLPRSTQQLMDRYVMELSDPETTPSSKDAMTKINLIEREIRAARGETGGPAEGAPPVDIDKALDSIFGPR